MRSPHKIGETFDLPLEQLALDQSYHERLKGDTNLEALATSIANVGQLHPVMVRWTHGVYHVISGVRRVAAMILHARNFDFKTVRCVRLEDGLADIIRLAENLRRMDPTTYETCRRVYEMKEGDHELPWNAKALSLGLGVTEHHVRFMARLYRDMPDEVKEVWQNDVERHFTFSVLRELHDVVQGGGDVQRVLARVVPNFEPTPTVQIPEIPEVTIPPIGTPPPRPPPWSHSRKTTSSQSGRRPPRLRPAKAQKLVRRLEAHRHLLQYDERAVMLFQILQPVGTGEVSPQRVEVYVEDILRDLGVQEVTSCPVK